MVIAASPAGNVAPAPWGVATESATERLRVFAIDAEPGLLTEITTPNGIRVGSGEAQSYGLALYRRAADGAVFAFVSPRRGGIEIESTPGEGTTVHVWLPSSRPQPDQG